MENIVAYCVLYIDKCKNMVIVPWATLDFLSYTLCSALYSSVCSSVTLSPTIRSTGQVAPGLRHIVIFFFYLQDGCYIDQPVVVVLFSLEKNDVDVFIHCIFCCILGCGPITY